MSQSQATHSNGTWKDKSLALERLFRALPIERVGKVTGIPYEFLIPDMGRQLLQMSPIPSRRKVVAAKKALRELVLSTKRAAKALDDLPQPVVDALNYRRVALGNLKTNLRILHCAAKQVDLQVRRGAPKKSRPEEIALVVAQHYYGLTGKKPTVPKKEGTAYGPFPELLGDVYQILGINESTSAFSQAEKISRNWKSIKAKLSIARHGIK